MPTLRFIRRAGGRKSWWRWIARQTWCGAVREWEKLGNQVIGSGQESVPMLCNGGLELDIGVSPVSQRKRRRENRTAAFTGSRKLSTDNTPALVECWRTAPYLHDGSAATIRDRSAPTRTVRMCAVLAASMIATCPAPCHSITAHCGACTEGSAG
jgi:hypothetical protein